MITPLEEQVRETIETAASFAEQGLPPSIAPEVALIAAAVLVGLKHASEDEPA